MTTSKQAVLALCRGAALLKQLAFDPSVPKALAERAYRIAITYPAPKAINDHLRESERGFPSDWVNTFIRAWHLFEELKCSGEGSERTMRDLRVTLRHYLPIDALPALMSELPKTPELSGPGDPLDK